MTSSEEDSEYGMVNTDEMVIRPYMYETLPKERRVSEDKSSSNDNDEEDLNIQRIGNTNWYVWDDDHICHFKYLTLFNQIVVKQII